jgi:hypothetical protein
MIRDESEVVGLIQAEGDPRFLPLRFGTKAAAVAGVPAGRPGLVFVAADESKAGTPPTLYLWDGTSFHHIVAIKEF